MMIITGISEGENRRQRFITEINGKTWAEVAEILGLSIPNLFRFLELTSFYI